MSEEHVILRATLHDLLDEHCTPEALTVSEGGWLPDLWRVLADAGLTTVGLPEATGGSGGDLADAAVVVETLAAHAAPVPVGEHALLAGWLAARGGRLPEGGPMTLAFARAHPVPHVCRAPGGWKLTGDVPGVPFASMATTLVVLARTDTGALAALGVAPSLVTLHAQRNVAGEPRDRVVLDAVDLPEDALLLHDVDGAEVERRGALLRSVQISGVLEAMLAATRRYVAEREQFGQPIARFQAVQHQLATLAGGVAVTSAAVRGAVAAPDDELAVAAAKVTSSVAATSCARVAHQLHGAMGFTQEHRLHHWTRRLWAWREEFGNERIWSRRIGEATVQTTPWSLLTAGQPMIDVAAAGTAGRRRP